MRNRSTKAGVVIVLALLLSACSHVTPPPQLSPIGDTAFYARRVIQAVGALQQAAIDGEKAGTIAPNDAAAIVNATRTAAKAGSDLADALAAGVSHESAKDQAVAVIKGVLDKLPENLSPHAREIVAPYISLINTFLSVFA